jgi:hypothetical protein
MPFSVLLLTAVSSKRQISGYGDSKVVMEGSLKPGEDILYLPLPPTGDTIHLSHLMRHA